MAPKKGSKIFHNPETKEVSMFYEKPPEPWVPGRPPWQDLTQTPEHVKRRAESMMRRVKESGPTAKELEGYKKLSQTRLEGDYSPTIETKNKIAETLKGQPQPWRENKSRASCRRNLCDIVYVLKVTTKEGKVFGKWGSSKEQTFKFREKEFLRKGFSWEVVFWRWFGESTEDTEAHLGRKLSPYTVEVPHFFGHTETFEWSEVTQKLLHEVINGLEENPAP
jgi:hypothetical protein